MTAIGRVIVVIDDPRFIVMVNMAMHHARLPIITWRRLVVMVNHSWGIMIIAMVMMPMMPMIMMVMPMIMMVVTPMVAVGVSARCESE